MIKSGGASTFGDLSLKYFNIFTAPLSIRNCHDIHIIFDQYWHSSIKEGIKDRLRFIPVHDVSRALGPGKCEALPALHALTGCDSNSSLAGIGQDPRLDDTTANKCESFICDLYPTLKRTSNSTDELRYIMFCQRRQE
ncbi:hypothetical protein QZH41_006793, partial [Actinostola sp. cb2023]